MRLRIFKITLLFIVIGSVYCSCQNIDVARNKLVFENSIEEVSDSLKRMDELIGKFPKTGMVNCFVDDDGYLYLNNQRIATIKGAINNNKVRNDLVFRDFQDNEIDEFFNLLAYLWKNHITDIVNEPGINLFTFSYRVKEVETKESDRFIIYLRNPSDTSSLFFQRHFKVLDYNDNLLLLGIK